MIMNRGGLNPMIDRTTDGRSLDTSHRLRLEKDGGEIGHRRQKHKGMITSEIP